ncbi:MAG TPA: NnrU family protein [Devosia sp.]|jgi:uncharacterized membrane protein|uniref:NnrU family protein n=1 Tax=Devosia sp. TaxID=1871048 RepID=UPI002DDCD41C|nr:NnrU family protein [Devosia sp.]HEV2515848.1 NnrU family protein [Devosia sp.]
MQNVLGGYAEFALALFAFFAAHAVPSIPGLRARLTSLFGLRTYLIAYSWGSIVLLAWLFRAAADAPFIELWPFAEWQRIVPAILMPVALCLAVFGLTTPNPLSLSVWPVRHFDADHPGIAGLVRHPILWATLLWSLAHLVPNGDLAHAVLFTTFGMLSVFGMLILDIRKRRMLGHDHWTQLAKLTSILPGAALARGWRPRPDTTDVFKAAAGLGAYVVLTMAHASFAGVPALPS